GNNRTSAHSNDTSERMKVERIAGSHNVGVRDLSNKQKSDLYVDMVHFIILRQLIKDYCFFFFQAEDGIRDYKVTGVQTCALPISDMPQGARRRYRLPWLLRQTRQKRRGCAAGRLRRLRSRSGAAMKRATRLAHRREIGRASCRERV